MVNGNDEVLVDDNDSYNPDEWIREYFSLVVGAPTISNGTIINVDYLISFIFSYCIIETDFYPGEEMTQVIRVSTDTISNLKSFTFNGESTKNMGQSYDEFSHPGNKLILEVKHKFETSIDDITIKKLDDVSDPITLEYCPGIPGTGSLYEPTFYTKSLEHGEIKTNPPTKLPYLEILPTIGFDENQHVLWNGDVTNTFYHIYLPHEVS